MTDKNANTEIRKEFCPNCEAETPCTHEAELFVCDICGEDFAKYIVSRNCNVSDVSTTQDVLMDIKTPSSIENTNPDYYKQEIARRDEELALTEKKLCNIDRSARAEIARLTAIIARLKEDGERLASGYEQVSREAVPYCVVCKKDAFSGYLGQIKHDDWCPITLHRALMNEIGG